MKLHILKIKEEFFDAILCGKKEFEVRYNDRDYQIGDLIHFVNVEGKEFGEERNEWGFKSKRMENGNEVWEIKYILSYKDFPEGIKEGYVILGLTEMSSY